MTSESSPFGPMHRAYGWRLTVAAVCTAVAAGCARALYSGLVPAERWIAILMLGCAVGAGALILGFDVTQRWFQLRRLRVVEDASKPYGFTGTVPRQTAANDLGGSTKH